MSRITARGQRPLTTPCVRILPEVGIIWRPGRRRIGLSAATRARCFGMHVAFFDLHLASGMGIALIPRRSKRSRRSARTCDDCRVGARPYFGAQFKPESRAL
jgi:hypothetical protein